MAGDVLAHVEVLAAVSLIAASARVRVIRAAIAEKLEPWATTVRRRLVRRSPRSVRLAASRRPSPPDDEPGGSMGIRLI